MNDLVKRDVQLPDFARCLECGAADLAVEVDGECPVMVCRRCGGRLPDVIDVCPGCNSHRMRLVGVSSVPGTVSTNRFRCLRCDRICNSNTCLRVPTLWFFSVMTDERMREDERHVDPAEVQGRQQPRLG